MYNMDDQVEFQRKMRELEVETKHKFEELSKKYEGRRKTDDFIQKNEAIHVEYNIKFREIGKQYKDFEAEAKKLMGL